VLVMLVMMMAVSMATTPTSMNRRRARGTKRSPRGAFHDTRRGEVVVNFEEAHLHCIGLGLVKKGSCGRAGRDMNTGLEGILMALKY
jgi:hypothetical protein